LYREGDHIKKSLQYQFDIAGFLFSTPATSLPNDDDLHAKKVLLRHVLF
jgi:hypothetical protein